jgi:hypothetical protein
MVSNTTLQTYYEVIIGRTFKVIISLHGAKICFLMHFAETPRLFEISMPLKLIKMLTLWSSLSYRKVQTF